MLDLGLTFLHRPALADIAKPWLLVLLHDVGSNERSLFDLAWAIPDRFHVVCLRAPHRMRPGAHAWFDFSITPGAHGIDETQEAASRAAVAQTVAAAALQLDIGPEQVVVGGFGQGGSMALSLLLTRPELMHAAIAWHSRLLAQTLPLIAPHKDLQGRLLWVSQGTHDTVVPPAHGQVIRHHLGTLPVSVTYHEFSCAHELRPSELGQTVVWLEELTTLPTSF